MRIETSGPWAFQDLTLFPDDETFSTVSDGDKDYRLYDLSGNKFLTDDNNEVLGVKKRNGHIILWGFMMSTAYEFQDYVKNL